MNIVHVAPFAPNQCGLYESARDMTKADYLMGHNVFFVDAGININNKLEFSPYGSIDNRSGFKLTTSDPIVLDFADIIIAHTYIPDVWLSRNDAPIVWIVHARPLASFRPEQNTNIKSYTMYAEVAKWKRTKAMVYFWDGFKHYWDVIFPEEKNICLEYPPIDLDRFNPNGEKHQIEEKHKGKYNVLICDSWREDIDLFEIVNGCIYAAKIINDIKFHFVGFENPIKDCWQILLKELQKYNALGAIYSRMPDMQKIYRAHDFLLTPHKIITRTIGEALACGLPVVASKGCKVANHTADISDPNNVCNEIINMCEILNCKNVPIFTYEEFDLKKYGQKMTDLYLTLKG
jgi:glycosyltransferase involved in cell wall biosynthesis